MINNEYKRMQKLAGILKENVGASQQWSDSIYDFITANLSNDEKELNLVIKALEETIDKDTYKYIAFSESGQAAILIEK